MPRRLRQLHAAAARRRPRRVVVYGPHKVGTQSLFATFADVEGIRAHRTHSPDNFRAIELGPDDVVLVGIRDLPWLRLSAFFQGLSRWVAPGTIAKTLTVAEAEAAFRAVDWSQQRFAKIDPAAKALRARFGPVADYREADWGSADPDRRYWRCRTAEGVHVVVYRLEHLGASFAALCAAVGLPTDIPLRHVNDAATKDYAALYAALKARYAPTDAERPKWYVRAFLTAPPPAAPSADRPGPAAAAAGGSDRRPGSSGRATR